MTKEEILAMEAGMRLDSLVAQNIMGGLIAIEHTPPYSTDISAAWQVEEKVENLGLSEKYANALASIIGGGKENARQLVFAFAHATPEIRCKAALLTKLEKG